MPFCLFYAICCEIYDVLIYALYPESFCVENLDIWLFLTLICKTKEFGLNRETKRFMKLQITVDKFHQVNHTSCGDTFKFNAFFSVAFYEDLFDKKKFVERFLEKNNFFEPTLEPNSFSEYFFSALF